MSTSINRNTDTIDTILGVEPGSAIAALRAVKARAGAPGPGVLPGDLRSHTGIRGASSRCTIARWSRCALPRIPGAPQSPIGMPHLARRQGRDATTRSTQVRDLTNAWSTPTPLGAAIRHADLLTTAPSSATAEDLQNG